MSAIVCGKRSSSCFDELHSRRQSPSSSPPSVSKRARLSSPSPPRTAAAAALLGQLREAFPDMDQQLLLQALKASDNNLDSAIKSLIELRIETDSVSSANPQISSDAHLPEKECNGDEQLVSANISSTENFPADGSEWVELFVREMTSATNFDDARTRASRLLQVLEENITNRANAEAVKSSQQEILMLKQQVEQLLRDNHILKRAVAIQHERQKEFDERNHEIVNLKQLISQYQERVSTLEVNNYALTLHLKQAQQSSSMPGRFHPDIF